MLLLSHGRVCMGLVALHEALAPLPGRGRRHVPVVCPSCNSRIQAFMINNSCSITDYDLKHQIQLAWLPLAQMFGLQACLQEPGLLQIP